MSNLTAAPLQVITIQCRGFNYHQQMHDKYLSLLLMRPTCVGHPDTLQDLQPSHSSQAAGKLLGTATAGDT